MAAVRLPLTIGAFVWLLWDPTTAFSQSSRPIDLELQKAEKAIAADDYRDALQHLAAAKKLDGANADELTAQAKEVGDLSREFEKVRPIMESANVEMGKFYCLIKGDWAKGIPLLAGGNDDKLRAAALAELEKPSDHAVQFGLGEKWWAAGQGLKGQQRTQALLRARLWYLISRPKVAEDDRKIVERRLKSMSLSVDKIVLWNTHNGGYRDRGSLECAVTAFYQDKLVSKKITPIDWNENGPSSATVRIDGKRIDQVLVEVTKWRGAGAGLAEIEVFEGQTNLARGCSVRASSYFEMHPASHPRNIIDGEKNGDGPTKCWVPDSGKQSWIRLYLVDFLPNQE